MVWIVRLVSVGAEGEEHGTDIMRITSPGDLTDLVRLGLTLAEGKRLLAGLQQEIVATQVRVHAARRPECRSCGTTCRVKDYRQHAIATLFGQVAVRLPRFRCAGCGAIAAGVHWPPHARSTPELDRLRAQLSALMTYRTAATLLGQMFPVDAPPHLQGRRAAADAGDSQTGTSGRDDHADLGFDLRPQLRGR